MTTKYEVHFTVTGMLTNFKEVIEADTVDIVKFRVILNERLTAEQFPGRVNEIFVVVEIK